MKKKHKKNKARSRKKSKGKKESPYVSFLPINKSAEVALYYGFTPIKSLRVSKEDVHKASSLKDSWTRNPAGMPWLFSQVFAEERIALLRQYIEEKLYSLPQPIIAIHETDLIKERAKNTISLEIMGSTRSIAEALLIKTAISILKDNKYKDFIIEINSIGDKESISKFSRELTNYYKKNLNSLSAHCRQNFKKDPFYILPCNECDPESKIKEAAPTSISCLSDVSRMNFKEILEYIETMKISYKINSCLVPDKKYCSGAVYEIKEMLDDGNAGETLAIGFRYDGIAQKIGLKKDTGGAGIKIFLKKKASVKKISKLPKPIAFYIQLGDEAKHRSLELIEMLRSEKIFVYHMIGRDKFGSQFAQVEKSKVPFVIIMGKKEFIENTVIVRENLTRNQVSIPIEKLAEYLKARSK